MFKTGKFRIKLGVPDGSSFPTHALIAAGDLFYRSDQKILYIYDGGWNPVASGVGVDNFIDLIDTPSAYSGYANYRVTVNGSENGLVFTPTVSGSVENFLDLGDTPSSYVGYSGYSAVVTDVEDGLEFRKIPGWENIITVAKSGGDYTSIQTAITAASADDVVLIMPGDYTENLTLKDDVYVVGLAVGRGDPIDISGNDIVRLNGYITDPTGVSAIVANITINYIADTSSTINAVSLTGTASTSVIEFHNVIINGENEGSGDARAVYLDTFGRFKIYHSRIRGVTGGAGDGYGIYADSSDSFDISNDVINCIFSPQDDYDIHVETGNYVRVIASVFDANKISGSGSIRIDGMGVELDDAFGIKLFDNAGSSYFDVQDVDGNTLFRVTSEGQVGLSIGIPHASSLLQLDSTTQGLRLPRMTEAQKSAITGITGLMIFNTSSGIFQGWNGSTWVTLG